ncbi:aldose epimerase family protein [Planctomicrobium piriforme]|uniref:Aldose 1-epimerase n=1 Tax=Planctomicrobium piriforme TaxID=1576369 RepID=A0A1I3DKC4_9PLAN|nr:aldose epimerase family protein [Planctomicrobium piriforme]SFH87165.1 aldose 1-epimerase [Planctomicrobium piriforme]
MTQRQSAWGRDADGSESSLFTLENSFLRVQVTDAGASLVSLVCADREGVSADIVAAPKSPSVYFQNPSYLGATVGRYANRIGRGRFWIDGRECVLAVNNGPNHLHGGLKGLTHRIWEAETGDNFVTFRTVSPDGEDGYPGNLTVSVTYRIADNVLSLDYTARTDAPTVVNLTNHTYWNLAGQGSILNQQLELFSDACLENDADVLPTGTILEVAGTPFDFRVPRAIGDSIAQTAGGYDNCFVVRGWDGTLRPVARAADMGCGRVMVVYTTAPGVQLYTANHFDGSDNCAGRQKFEAFCLECQHFPDSPNQIEFPSTALRPGEEYRQTTEHRFFTAK